MSILNDFSIPLSGLEFGLHHYTFKVESNFFSSYDSTIVDNGDFNVDILLDKKSRTIVADIDVKGASKVSCDRCLESISLPIQGHQKYTFQIGNKEVDELEDLDINIISEEQLVLDLSIWIHETICLATPIMKIYDCDQDPNSNCNEDILNRLMNKESQVEKNPTWDILKEIKK